ncbi:MBL fold metallo-hydrolase [Lutibacter sp. B2]|nr:MBL fold metallo-hydrolase [Lutibacter sp. B2]
MNLKRFTVGMLETNGYVLYDEDTLKTCVIDPGDEGKTFIEYIEKNHLKLTAVILTHHHYDHIGAVSQLKKKYDVPVYIHKKDIIGLSDPTINYSASSSKEKISMQADKILSDGELINIGNTALEVVHTPGHTHGSICLKVKDENIIFTGDTIFNVDIGRMDLEDGSEKKMKNSIKNKVSKWSDDVIIYPGHGDCATMKSVREKNREFLYMLK